MVYGVWCMMLTGFGLVFILHEFRWSVVDHRIQICALMDHWFREFANGMVSKYLTAGVVNLYTFPMQTIFRFMMPCLRIFLR